MSAVVSKKGKRMRKDGDAVGGCNCPMAVPVAGDA